MNILPEKQYYREFAIMRIYYVIYPRPGISSRQRAISPASAGEIAPGNCGESSALRG
jgi:hypothetical protein